VYCFVQIHSDIHILLLTDISVGLLIELPIKPVTAAQPHNIHTGRHSAQRTDDRCDIADHTV